MSFDGGVNGNDKQFNPLQYQPLYDLDQQPSNPEVAKVYPSTENEKLKISLSINGTELPQESKISGRHSTNHLMYETQGEQDQLPNLRKEELPSTNPQLEWAKVEKEAFKFLESKGFKTVTTLKNVDISVQKDLTDLTEKVDAYRKAAEKRIVDDRTGSLLRGTVTVASVASNFFYKAALVACIVALVGFAASSVVLSAFGLIALLVFLPGAVLLQIIKKLLACIGGSESTIDYETKVIFLENHKKVVQNLNAWINEAPKMENDLNDWLDCLAIEESKDKNSDRRTQLRNYAQIISARKHHLSVQQQAMNQAIRNGLNILFA